jgi:hypothetical protein
MNAPSELAVLVETEARLDDVVASARRAAEEAREAAQTRARVAQGRLEAQIALERARIASAVAAETAQLEKGIHERARARLQRYEAMRGPALADVAYELGRRLREIAMEDA